jgi:spoIIIJ-associated protein
MEQAETGRQWLVQLLDLMGYPAGVEISDTQSSPRQSTSLTIDRANLRPHHIQALIGTDGVTIDAIQHLANACLNAHLPLEAAHFYLIELNDYRKERLVVLQDIAETAIAHVKSKQQDYEIKGLSAAERRQLHMFFEDYPEIETFSQGKEPNRSLMVHLRLSDIS